MQEPRFKIGDKFLISFQRDDSCPFKNEGDLTVEEGTYRVKIEFMPDFQNEIQHIGIQFIGEINANT